jgi:hypothetical protein
MRKRGKDFLLYSGVFSLVFTPCVRHRVPESVSDRVFFTDLIISRKDFISNTVKVPKTFIYLNY